MNGNMTDVGGFVHAIILTGTGQKLRGLCMPSYEQDRDGSSGVCACQSQRSNEDIYGTTEDALPITVSYYIAIYEIRLRQ